MDNWPGWFLFNNGILDSSFTNREHVLLIEETFWYNEDGTEVGNEGGIEVGIAANTKVLSTDLESVLEERALVTHLDELIV